MSYTIVDVTPEPFAGASPLPMLTAAQLRSIMTRTEVDEGGCWNWTGSSYVETGYARYEIGGKTYKVYRLMCHFFNGGVPPHLVVDHRCENKRCVNPAHLEAVPIGVNTMRGDNARKRAARQTHCKRGHEFTPENTLMQRARDGELRQRACKACAQMRKQERKAGLR